MTFARSVKEELTRKPLVKREMLPELSALLRINSEVEIRSDGTFIVFQSNNIPITRRFFSLVKELYDSEMDLLSKKDLKLKNRGMVVVVKTNTQAIINEHSLIDANMSEYELLIQSNDEKRAYLRGAFLAGGSVNDPSKPTYHLEIFVRSKKEAILIQRMMNHFELNAKITQRRTGLIVYVKEADAISKFLMLVGAFDGVFKFEDLRIQRDFNNSINRLINCEIANEKKTLEAANEQLLQIKLIKQYKDVELLDEKLLEIINLREENPDASLNELAVVFEQKTGERISKSGINHRLQKIKELAYKIIEELKEQNHQL